MEKKKQEGITGIQFLLSTGAFLTVMFCVGLLIAPDEVKMALATNLGTFILKLTIKIGILLVWSFLVTWVIFFNVLDCKLSELKERFVRSHNDSHAYMVGAIVLAGTVILALSSGNTLRAFVYTVLTQGSIGVAISTVFTLVAARVFGIKDMDQFRDWINAEDNDSYAVIVSVVWVSIILLAMSL